MSTVYCYLKYFKAISKFTPEFKQLFILPLITRFKITYYFNNFAHKLYYSDNFFVSLYIVIRHTKEKSAINPYILVQGKLHIPYCFLPVVPWYDGLSMYRQNTYRIKITKKDCVHLCLYRYVTFQTTFVCLTGLMYILFYWAKTIKNTCFCNSLKQTIFTTVLFHYGYSWKSYFSALSMCNYKSHFSALSMCIYKSNWKYSCWY